MKSLIAFATNALATVGSTAAGKAAIVITTVAVAGTSTAGVATIASRENKASLKKCLLGQFLRQILIPGSAQQICIHGPGMLLIDFLKRLHFL